MFLPFDMTILHLSALLVRGHDLFAIEPRIVAVNFPLNLPFSDILSLLAVTSPSSKQHPLLGYK